MVDRGKIASDVTSSGAAAKLPDDETKTPDDASLRREMVAYQGGSLEAFQSLYAVLHEPLLRYLRYLTRNADRAEDLLQETFLQLHKSRAAYDPSYPARPWAFGLARNVFLMQRRAAARFAAVHQDAEEMPELAVPSGLEQWVTGERIRGAVGSLDPEQAEALVLHHVWGFSFEEIAGLVGISSAAARARSSRAMSALREILTRDREEGS